MVNWLNFLAHLVWILGLVLLLSTLSLAHWQSLQQHRPFRQLVLEPFFHLTTITGISLFALGLALVVVPWWYKLGWIGLMAVAAWQGVVAWRRVTW